jgi:hypothetical protein
MLRRVGIGFAALLLTIIIAATLNSPIKETDSSKLYASYARRFEEGNALYEWIMPADLPQLARFSEVIVLGTVTQIVTPQSGLGVEGEAFKVSVNAYLKAPEYVDPRTILVLQIVGESRNPVIQPGDECVFFLTPFYGQNQGPGVVYSLGGDYTRYVVYGSRVYSVASLNPRNVSPESQIRGEPLPDFLFKVWAMIN